MEKGAKVADNETSRSGAFNTLPALTTSAAKDSDDMATDDSNASGKSPAFRFYPLDFIGGTLLLSTEEIGAYLLLLCHAWDKGEVPHDLTTIARIARLSVARMRKAWNALEPKFQRTDTGYVNIRMEKERQ